MNAPQITIADIRKKVKKVEYMVLPNSTVTICNLTLENGFSVRGESACVSQENFNIAIGEKYAYEDAINKVWPLEGYLLKEKLFREAQECGK